MESNLSPSSHTIHFDRAHWNVPLLILINLPADKKVEPPNMSSRLVVRCPCGLSSMAEAERAAVAVRKAWPTPPAMGGGRWGDFISTDPLVGLESIQVKLMALHHSELA